MKNIAQQVRLNVTSTSFINLKLLEIYIIVNFKIYKIN